jgi:hypothetical protein
MEKALKRTWALISRCAFVFWKCPFFTFVKCYFALKVQRCRELPEKVLNRMRALTSRMDRLTALTTADTLVQSHKASAVENLKIVEKALEAKPKGIVNNQFTVADIPLYQVSVCQTQKVCCRLI